MCCCRTWPKSFTSVRPGVETSGASNAVDDSEMQLATDLSVTILVRLFASHASEGECSLLHATSSSNWTTCRISLPEFSACCLRTAFFCNLQEQNALASAIEASWTQLEEEAPAPVPW